MNNFIIKTIRNITFLAFLLMLSCSEKKSSKISTETNQIVKRIEKINILMGSAVGSAGIKPTQYKNFEALKKSASKNELILLTNHANGVVRCYSFMALATLKNIELFPIVKDHIQDDGEIEIQFGCIRSVKKVGDFFISLVNPKYENSEIRQLTQDQFSELSDILINQKNNLDTSYEVIENVTPTKSLYPKIREMVIKKNNQSALVTLAKYRNPNDIELILKNRDKYDYDESGYFFTYRAIQNFPNPLFLPFLEKRLFESLDNDHFSNEWLEMYTAIACYKSPKSLELLKTPFTKVQHQKIKEYHIKFVNEAILANKHQLYDDLLWKIWLDEHIITLDGFKYLLQVNSAKTLEFAKKELVPNYQIKKTETTVPQTNTKMLTENLEETLLNFILLNDKPFAYGILKEKIANASVNDFEIYCAKILELNDSSFKENLFKRLSNEDNPHVYLQIVETLVSFKDNAINKKILETRKKNKNMNEDWGSDSLDEILKKNNIK